MTALKAGLLVATVQALLVASVGAKFLIDRAQYPRAWIATLPLDPDLPIRGRYVRLVAVVNTDDPAAPALASVRQRVHLEVRAGELSAILDAKGHHWIRPASRGQARCWVLAEPLAYFIPEHMADPTRRTAGEELWVEASIPPSGPPRPIRLGAKSNAGIEPIEIR